jgi:hypothetical protein
VPLKPPIMRVTTLGSDFVKIKPGKPARRPASL